MKKTIRKDMPMLAIFAVAAILGYLEVFDRVTVFVTASFLMTIYIGIKLGDSELEIEALKRRIDDSNAEIDKLRREVLRW
ncbi:hypothetical protein [Agrobacterium vitis]|uniref:hypothetical protein n=1 Tax=Agrobacterium vitis TaxID=373 RepID=UPI0012E915F1|nr:hypothetical protein [Agrobacterium vitis]MUZ61428.1 hypothetical protein [Agrobacterium vitis]